MCGARWVWETIKSALVVDRSGSVVLKELMRNCGKPAILDMKHWKETIAVGAWYIWWQRRQAVKGEHVAPAPSSAFAIHALSSKFSIAARPSESREIIWKKPPSKIYKLNVDASYFEDGSGASGAVVRDDKGAAVAGAAKVFDHLLDLTIAEAFALQGGLELVESLGCVPVIVESDSLELIQACNGIIEIWSPYTAILADCFQKAQRIGNISFQHCPREANMVAHNLAKHAYDTKQNVFWDSDPPSFIIPYVTDDVSIIKLK